MVWYNVKLGRLQILIAKYILQKYQCPTLHHCFVNFLVMPNEQCLRLFHQVSIFSHHYVAVPLKAIISSTKNTTNCAGMYNPQTISMKQFHQPICLHQFIWYKLTHVDWTACHYAIRYYPIQKSLISEKNHDIRLVNAL